MHFFELVIDLKIFERKTVKIPYTMRKGEHTISTQMNDQPIKYFQNFFKTLFHYRIVIHN